VRAGGGMRAWRRAAPFPPLPEAIRERADLLVITFQFPDP